MLIIDHFEQGVLRFPDRAVAVENDRVLTYREMDALMRQIAQTLLSEGLGSRASVGILSPNHMMVLACQYGILKAGMTWVPINYRNSAPDNVAQLRQYETSWLFFHSSLVDHARLFCEQSGGKKNAVCIDIPVDGFPFLPGWLADQLATHPFPDRKMDDPIAIMSTGGTTGDPKGAVHTNRSFECVISSVYALFQFSAPPVHLIVAPLTHAAAIFHYTMLATGGTHILLSDTDPTAILEAIQQHKVSVLYLPPTLIYRVLAHPALRTYDCSSLKYLLYGAAPMSAEKLREAIDFFGPILIQSYGQTECLMWATALTPNDHQEIVDNPLLAHRIMSVGRPGPFCRTEILRDDGTIAENDERGEIAFRSDLQMRRFFRNFDATSELRVDGWQRSGDIGYRDSDGFIYVVDRKRDLIISGGFNVFPGEVEQAVLAHTSIQDCVVVGVPDEKWGEMVVAAVELKPGHSIESDELIEFCKERVGSIKAPKRIEIWPELPRSTVGKTLRRTVRDKYWQGRERQV